MKISTALALLLATLLATAAAQVDAKCPANHFHLIGSYTLGKQDELNRTFTYIQQTLKQIGNISFNSTPSIQYNIFNTKPTFYYRDSKQRAEILSNDTIVILGGYLEADITFQWSKVGLTTKNGTGMAFGLSDQISFVKTIVIENDTSYGFELFDYSNVTWATEGEVFKVTRIDPADATDEDKSVILKMLNNLMGYKSIRILLEDEIDKIFSYYLRASLHDEHHHIQPQFDYIWSPGRNQTNVSVSIIRRPVTIDIEKDGIRTTFDIQAEKANKWTCGNRSVPILPLNPKVYGHTQEFVSYDFYENMIRYAIENNLFDTNLAREPWQSTMFQFFAGDLYQIFPLLQKNFYANEPIDGNCKATYTGLKIWKASHDSFNVSIHFDCELNVKRNKFVDFAVGLQLEIEGNPAQTYMHFRLRRHDQFPSFYPYGDYKIQNTKLAELMVHHSVNRLYERRLFGSGFPASPPRDYPHFIAEQNYTIVYDSTHVDPAISLNDITDNEEQYLVIDEI